MGFLFSQIQNTVDRLSILFETHSHAGACLTLFSIGSLYIGWDMTDCFTDFWLDSTCVHAHFGKIRLQLNR